MAEKANGARNTHKRKITTLLLLVLFVFAILFVSVLFAGIISYILVDAGILPTLLTDRVPIILIFMLLISLFIGTILAIIGGDYFLRPLRRLTDATKEVAAGNFDISVKVGGSTEISRLAESFNEMARALQSIETLRSDFISNISHEYKTPVVSIRGFARRLKKGNLTCEQQSEYLDIIISETERLTNLSSNVLLLSNLEGIDDAADTSAYALDEQLRRSILLLEPQIQKKQLELDINLEPVRFTGNEEIMRHLFINLLGNAIKFNREGGAVHISLHADNARAVVSIRDTGPGMDDEVKRHIFDKFYQEDRSRSTEGNGLGLSLVKRIVEIHGGDIAVSSTPGVGTCFTVYLPISA